MAALICGVSAAAHKERTCGIPVSPILACNGRRRMSSIVCRASPGGRSTTQQYEYDLYDLLGVERNASLQEIRRSYRWLQKKCHPDIAGLIGHDMSILLNQAYTTLADPNQRAVYDQALADFSELQGYTGCPLYSKWLGPPHEEKAVFVDESRCVGCLKCALIAPNTFAIESRFGRARVVGQWADPQPAIEDAIKACPVDCISWVERSRLAALEYIMSKEPRFPVGVNAHSNGGVRLSDVFKGAERFLEKLKQQEKKKTVHAMETPAQREARLAAMGGVHARSGRWWYYFIGNPNAMDQTYPSFNREAHGAIVPLSFYDYGGMNKPNSGSSGNHGKDGFEFQSELHRLFEAAKKRRQGQAASPGGGADDEYWVPFVRTGGPVSFSVIENEPMIMRRDEKAKDPTNGSWIIERKLSGWMHHVLSGGPVVMAVLAAWFVGATSVPGVALSSSEMGVGLVPIDWMQSTELQIVSVAAVWYLVGAVLANASVLLVNLLQKHSNERSSH